MTDFLAMVDAETGSVFVGSASSFSARDLGRCLVCAQAKGSARVWTFTVQAEDYPRAQAVALATPVEARGEVRKVGRSGRYVR